MNDFWKFAAVALLSVGGTLALQGMVEKRAPGPSDCDCTSEAPGPGVHRGGLSGEVADLRQRIETIEGRLSPGLRPKPGSAGEAPN